MIDAKIVSQLRAMTGAGIVECKKALEEAGGDLAAAAELLRKKGIVKAASKSDRHTSEGLVYAYIHGNGKVGAMVEVLCETDFVARTDGFKELCHELALQIAAMNPLYVSSADTNAILRYDPTGEFIESLASKQTLGHDSNTRIL